MFRKDYNKTSDGAAAKVAFMNKDPLAYFVVSMLAGAYIGIGVLLAFTSGGLLTGQPHARIVMGLTFGVALSLVVMAGAELFTGNNLAMAAGLLDKKVSWKDALKLWCICWAGQGNERNYEIFLPAEYPLARKIISCRSCHLLGRRSVHADFLQHQDQ